MSDKEHWDWVEAKLAATFYVVEATGYERLTLWQENQRRPEPLPWEEESRGSGQLVGRLDDMPVFLSLTWARIASKWVMFYHPTSVVVDHRLIDAWLEEHCNPQTTSDIPARCDAMNFSHCLQEIRRA